MRRLGVKVIEGLTALLILAGGSAPLLGCEDGTAVPDPENNPGLVGDCKVLLEIRDELAGEGYLNWTAGLALNEWYGVTVSGSPGRVSSLSLFSDQLTGEIPTELGKLSSLQGLYLYDNQLTGEIPAELGQLSSLQQLYLYNNQLTGEIPAELGQLSSLQWLLLDNNQLTGEIPAELGQLSSLQGLSLHDNQLTGEIPAELGQLSSLQQLYLYNNQLTGEIPAELEQLSSLQGLSLYNNQLTGEIPAELGQLSSLQSLYLHDNQLTGEIPAELGQLSSLQWLYLYNNQLTGEIPAELGQLSSLQWLYLYDNQLTGEIPAELGQLSSLQWLILYNNQLTGEIPAELGQLSSLQSLLLDNNQLTGEIPAELGQLSSLQGLYLYNNQLTGEIPAELGQLSSLQWLYLYDNQLTGEIPAELGQLSSLQWLYLYDNQLTGEIPAELGQLSSLQSLYLYNNQLTGEIPAELGQLSSLQWLYLYDNQLTGEIPAELGQLSSLQGLYLYNNQLTGEIPAELGQLSNLESLHLQHNRLTGPIPAELGQLSNLVEFSFRGNRLTGPVPAELRHLPDVYLLNLRASRLTQDRIKVSWDDPGDPAATYQYRLLDGTGTWTDWSPIADPETILKKGEGVTIEWTLTGLSREAVYYRIEIMVSNPSGHSTAMARIASPVMPMASEPDGSLFVPVLLTSAGRNDAFFTSELTLTNRGTVSATLHYTYTAHAGGGSGTATDSLAPESQRIQSDAIGYLTGLGIRIPGSGNRIGTLRVEASGSSEVSVTARTTTAVPEGRAGLAYPGIARDQGFEEAVYLCGLRQNTQDRSNVAFQNMGAPDQGPITLRATVFSGEAGDTSPRVVGEVELHPGGFHQYNETLKALGSPAQGYVKVEKVAGDAPFYAYGVINDNFNSDGSFVFPLTESSLVGADGQTLPVIIETGSFRSELTVTNFSSSEKQVNFGFVADVVDTDDDTATFSLDLKAGEQRILPDLVSWLRRQEVDGIGPANRAFVGALVATPAEGDMSGIVIGARTGAPDRRGGQYSLFYNAVPHGSASVDSAWVYGLQQNAENRSNLALVNTGEIDDSSSTLEITIYDGSGESQPRTKSVTLGPRRWHQENGILGNISQGYVQVRKTSGNNPFITYGVINDGGRPGERSGDGAFLLSQE